MQNMQHKQIIQQQLPQLLQEVSESVRLSFQQNPTMQKEYANTLVAFVSERKL
jgi:hypothetical protein